jgi:hypothetical protein
MFGTPLTSDQIKDLFKELFNPRIFHPDEFWMIVWIGKLFIAHGNLLSEVFLARISQKSLSTLNANSLEYSKGQTINFPARFLNLLQPGTIFQDGERLEGQQHNYIRRYTFSIKPESLESVQLKEWGHGQELRSKIGLSSIKTGYKGNRESYANDFGENSRILVVKNFNSHIEADYIIFPAAEVARFHWFSSTQLTMAVIHPSSVSLKKNVFYVPESLKNPDDDSPYHFLRIRDEMKVRDIARIARLAFSLEARQSAGKIQILNITSAQFGQQREFHIDTSFPFKEKTEQSVYGLYIKLASSTILLVLEIDECGSEFPFDILRFSREAHEVKVDLTLPRTEGEGIFTDKREKQDDETEKKDEEKPEPKYQYYFDAKFDGQVTKKASIKNDSQFIPLQYITKKASYSSLTTDIKRLGDPERVAARKERRQTRKAENLSTNENTERNTRSVGLEHIQEEIVYRICEGNYSDLVRLSAKYIRNLKGKVFFHNNIDEFGQEDFCDLIIKQEAFDPPLLSADTLKAIMRADGSQRRIIAMTVELNGKHFLYLELEPDGETAFWIFTKREGKSSNARTFLEFNKDDLIAALRSFSNTANSKAVKDQSQMPFNITAKKFYHKKMRVGEHVDHILKNLPGFLKK